MISNQNKSFQIKNKTLSYPTVLKWSRPDGLQGHLDFFNFPSELQVLVGAANRLLSSLGPAGEVSCGPASDHSRSRLGGSAGVSPGFQAHKARVGVGLGVG